MTEVTRRTVLATALASGTAGWTAQAQDDEPPGAKDRSYVMAAGMTEEEAICWGKIADAAGAFFALPELHPMDKTEVATAIHIIQHKLLARPTYRKYLELAKAGAKEK